MKKKIFFIGIGGKGLNGIAQICLEKNYQVSGFDKNRTPETQALINKGANIFYHSSKDNLDSDTDFVVRTSIVNNSPEIEKARKLGIPILKRSEFLKILIKNSFKISIAGSHGKSTTTAILGLSMINSNLEPDIYGGAFLKELNSYNYLGQADKNPNLQKVSEKYIKKNQRISITEACEYDKSFLDLIGDISIITRMEKSHMEYYKTEELMIDAFRDFFEMHNKKSKIILNGDDQNLMNLYSRTKAEIITFGTGELNDYQILNLKLNKEYTEFSLIKNAKETKFLIKDLRIKIPGKYNVMNFAACIALYDQLNISFDGIFKTAENFTGVGRRFEIIKDSKQITLVDDFAHHPTQVKNLIDSLRQFYPGKKICAVFQPRQFNLIKNFLIEYGESFKDSDDVIITDILPALGDSEKDKKSLKIKDLINVIELYSQKKVVYENNIQEIGKLIKNKYNQNTVVATIGAGDIYKLRDYV